MDVIFQIQDLLRPAYFPFITLLFKKTIYSISQIMTIKWNMTSFNLIPIKD